MYRDSWNKHTKIPNENKIVTRNRASKPIKVNVQNPLSTTGIARGADGRFTSTENNITAEHTENSSNPRLEETLLDSTIDMETIPTIPGYGRRRRKSLRIRTTPSPGGNNLRFYAVMDRNGKRIL